MARPRGLRWSVSSAVQLDFGLNTQMAPAAGEPVKLPHRPILNSETVKRLLGPAHGSPAARKRAWRPRSGPRYAGLHRRTDRTAFLAAAESFEKLLDKAPDDFRRAFLLCGWWGAPRLSEALFLEWEPSETVPWLDFVGKRVVLPADFAKGEEDQMGPPPLGFARGTRRTTPDRQAGVHVPLSEDRQPLTRSGVTNRVLALAKKAGVKLALHKLRKGFGCRAAKVFGKTGAVMLHEPVRPSSMQVTMDCYADVDDALRDSIRSVKQVDVSVEVPPLHRGIRPEQPKSP